MTDAGVAATTLTGTANADPNRPARAVECRRIARHGFALTVLLLMLLPLFDGDFIALPDEGVYSAQAAALAAGSWSAPRPVPGLDPTGQLNPLTPDTTVGVRHIPYSRHPAYPLLLSQFYRLLGTPGLLLVSVIGTVIAATTTALLAMRFNPKFALPALWLIGVGSPLFMDSFLVSAQALAVGAGAVMLLGLTRALEDDTIRSLGIAIPAAAGLAMLRSEGVLMVAATAAVTGLGAVRWRRPFGIEWRRAGFAVALAIAGGFSYLADNLFSGKITGNPASGNGFARKPDLLASAWNSLLKPWAASAVELTPSPIIVLLSILLAALLIRFDPKRPLLAIALVVMAAGAALLRQSEPLLFIGGLFPTAPILLGGVILIPKESLRRPIVAHLAGIAGLSTLLISATAYGDGGQSQWGGRFYHVILPALVPLAILGLERARQVLPRNEALIAGAAVLIVTCSFAILALRTNQLSRSTQRSVVQTSLSFAKSVAPPNPLIVVGPLKPNGNSRMFWRQVGDGREILSAIRIDNMHSILQSIDESGRAEVVLLTDVPTPVAQRILRRTLTKLGWSITTSQVSDDGSANVIRIARDGT